MSQEACDIVIVGAGAAGCVVASYLAEHTDASIALIEAGDTDRDPFIHIPAGFAKILAHDRHVWKYETVPQHGTKRAYRSGKVLGGGSSINAMCYVRGQIRETWSPCIPDDIGFLGHQCLSLSRHLYRSINTRNWRSPIAVPEPEIDWTILWRVTLQRRRGKSPLAIESTEDGYCRSPRRVMP